MKQNLTKKCDTSGWSAVQQEVGCPLDHCMCGTHDAENTEHVCQLPDEDEAEIAMLERAAGWSAKP